MVFTAFMGLIVMHGIRSVDLTNRALMILKISVYGCLVAFALPYVEPQRLTVQQPSLVLSSLPVVLASFSFGNISLPLRKYFGEDGARLFRLIFFGSLIL